MILARVDTVRGRGFSISFLPFPPFVFLAIVIANWVEENAMFVLF